MSTFKCGKYSFPLNKKIYVMGILNVTPDSFSDGGLFLDPKNAIAHAIKMQNEGADIIDIGAQSTRPGCTKLSEALEWNRLKSIVPELVKNLDIPISIDTFYPNIAKNCLDLGVSIINDVTGFENSKMWNVASNSNCGCIIMHNGPFLSTKNFFKKSLLNAKKYGIPSERICLDPGIGFGKNFDDNINVIKNLKDLKVNNCPMLMALSKKSFIAKICGGAAPHERVSGTIVANTISILNGANFIRVHDVKDAVMANKVLANLL